MGTIDLPSSFQSETSRLSLNAYASSSTNLCKSNLEPIIVLSKVSPKDIRLAKKSVSEFLLRKKKSLPQNVPRIFSDRRIENYSKKRTSTNTSPMLSHNRRGDTLKEEIFLSSHRALSANQQTDISKSATSQKCRMFLGGKSSKRISAPKLSKIRLNNQIRNYSTKASCSDSSLLLRRQNKFLSKQENSTKSSRKLLDNKHQNFSKKAEKSRKHQSNGKPCNTNYSPSTASDNHSNVDTFLSFSSYFSSPVSDSYGTIVPSQIQSTDFLQKSVSKKGIDNQNQNKQIGSENTQKHISITEMKRMSINPSVVLQKLSQEDVIIAQKNVQLLLDRKNVSSQMHTLKKYCNRHNQKFNDKAKSKKKVYLHKNRGKKYDSGVDKSLEIASYNLAEGRSLKNDVLPLENMNIKSYHGGKSHRNSPHKTCNETLNFRKENVGEFYRSISEKVKNRRHLSKKDFLSSNKSSTKTSINQTRKKCRCSFRLGSNEVSMSNCENHSLYETTTQQQINIESQGSCNSSYQNMNTEVISPEIEIDNLSLQLLNLTLSDLEHEQTELNNEVLPQEPDNKSGHREKKKKKDMLKDCLNKRFNEKSVAEKGSVNFYCHENFYQSVEKIFDSMEDVNISSTIQEHAELLISSPQLEKLSNEAGRMKSLRAMNKFPSQKLDHLLSVLEIIITDGCHLVAAQMTTETEGRKENLYVKSTMERIMRSANASVTALYIITSKMKKIFVEDVIEKIVLFIKEQLYYTIFPEFDCSYRLESKPKDESVSDKKQKHYPKQSIKKKSLLHLYNKLHEILHLLRELLDQRILVDTLVLQISTLAIDILFVEGIAELQLKAVHIVTVIFSRHDKLRQIILKEILASIIRLPTNKKAVRNYRLTSGQNIQIFTALILQLMHSVIRLPKFNLKSMSVFSLNVEKNKISQNTDRFYEDKDDLIVQSYQESVRTALRFLSAFLERSFQKEDKMNYKILFENFVQDLLNTLSMPEWPSSELLLSILGKMLVRNLIEKSTEMSLRVASVEFFGLVAAHLQKNKIACQNRMTMMESIIQSLVNEDERKLEQKIDETQILQRALLQYLDLRVEDDADYEFARRFYITLWYKDIDDEKRRRDEFSNENQSLYSQKNKKKKPASILSAQVHILKNREEARGKEKDKEECKIGNLEKEFHCSVLEDAKKLFLLKIIERQDRSKINIKMKKHINNEEAQIISEYLASSRPFQQNLDFYITVILYVLNETAVALRAKAIKCLTMVVENDPDVLSRLDVQRSVQGRLLDTSISVREATVDLLSKFILARPQFMNQYYEMLGERILDIGVTVRKKVIKIFTSVCLKHPDFPKIPEICVKIMKRINDEDSIKKLVTDFFHNVWFYCLPDENSEQVLTKVKSIIHVVKASSVNELEFFKQLLMNLLSNEKDGNHKSVLKSSKMIVDCLVENLMKLDETYQSAGDGMRSNFITCLKVLCLFSEIRPSLVVPHAFVIESYLSIECIMLSDVVKINNIAVILEMVVPLMEHPSDNFLDQIEEDLMIMLLRQHLLVLSSCLKCLSAIVNKVTHNYKFVKYCFQECFNIILKYRNEYQNIPESRKIKYKKPKLLRSLYMVGLFCCYFNFSSLDIEPEHIGKLCLEERVLESLLFFNHHSDINIRMIALEALGFLLIKHPDIMLKSVVKNLYYDHLISDTVSSAFKCQVLKNITTFLVEDVKIMTLKEYNWDENSKSESLKDMGEEQAGMASTIAQVYLEQILQCALHAETIVRLSTLSVIQIILSQGLIHPTQTVLVLVCLGTDDDPEIWTKANYWLLEIGKNDPVHIQMKAARSVRMSFEFQRKIHKPGDIVRGFRNLESPVSRNCSLYSAIRAKKQCRRALLLSLLKLFDEEKFFDVNSPTSLTELLYIADNIAYFPYMVQDEPLFLMHHLDLKVCVLLSNSLQTFQESLKDQQSSENIAVFPNGKEISSHDNDENVFEILKSRLPEDTAITQKCIIACYASELLLYVKNTLMKMYDLTNKKIEEYSPNELSKKYKRPVTRKKHVRFDPETVLTFIKSGGFENQPDEKRKDELVFQYLRFKRLMSIVDLTNDSDEEDNSSKIISSTSANSFVFSSTKSSENETIFEYSSRIQT